MTLLVSAIALKLHDKGKTEQCLLVNKIGSRVVISAYVLLNLIFVVSAII
jgi:hypothetical protein